MKETVGLPSVSTILNPISYMGLIDVDKDILENAANRGTRVGEFIQASIEGKALPKLQQQDIPYIKAMNKLIKENPEHKENILKSECEFKFTHDKYQGRMDFYNSNENIVYELKTTSSITLSNKLQLWAYANTIISNGKLSQAYLISLKKDGSYKIYNLKDWNNDYLESIFTKLMELYYLGCERGGSPLKNMFTKRLK